MNYTKMLRLVIRFKKDDKIGGVFLRDDILQILKKGGISGATEWIGIGGYGKHGKPYATIEGIQFNAPCIIETVDEFEKIQAILPMLRDVVNDHGIVALHEVMVV
jgi:PII-like signaling protein